MCIRDRFNEDKEAGGNAELEVRNPAVEELMDRAAYRTPARAEGRGLSLGVNHMRPPLRNGRTGDDRMSTSMCCQPTR
eukprot:15474380-Alexandrium_andersonii.AAC.1